MTDHPVAEPVVLDGPAPEPAPEAAPMPLPEAALALDPAVAPEVAAGPPPVPAPVPEPPAPAPKPTRPTNADGEPLARVYNARRNKEEGIFPGVPWRDLTMAEWRDLPKTTRDSIDADVQNRYTDPMKDSDPKH